MIRNFKQTDINEVMNILCSSFDMSDTECLKMLEMIEPSANLFVVEADNEIACVASAVPVSIGNKKGRYIYAVATEKNKRNKGYATKLLKYLVEFFKDTDVVLLKPANEKLFGFYKKIGFDIELNADVRDYYPENYGYEINKCDVNEYITLRKQLNAFNYPDKVVRYYFECYNYSCATLLDTLALYRIEGETCYIDEIYGNCRTRLIQSIIKTENIKKAIVTKEGNTPFALAHFYNKQFDIQFRIPME